MSRVPSLFWRIASSSAHVSLPARSRPQLGRRTYGIDLTARPGYRKPGGRDLAMTAALIAFVIAAVNYDQSRLLLYDGEDEWELPRVGSSKDLDASKSARPMTHAFTGPAAPTAIVKDEGTKVAAPEEMTIDKDSSLPFPNVLRPLSTSYPVDFVGCGVRKVSFLKVKVYAVGFYASPIALNTLSSLPSWRNYSKARLVASAPTSESPATGEQLMRTLLEQPYDFALRIVPTRPTDGSHLRDGFSRAIVARQDAAKKRNELSEEDNQAINKAVNDFKIMFIKGSVPKGKDLVLVRRGRAKSLALEYDGKVLGEVKNDFISRELFLAYFADRDPISPLAKESIAAGFERIIRGHALSAAEADD